MRELESQIQNAGIIVVLRGDFPPERLSAIAGAIIDAGITVLELTLNSTNASAGIRMLLDQYGDRAIIGAGTARNVADVETALATGARFIVSPNFDAASVARSHAAGVPHLPGVFTPSEVQDAHAAGCGLVKLFPIDIVGPRYLKALRAPLNDVGFVAVGGVDENNLGDYIRAGAVAVGVGSSLAKPEDTPERIREKASRLVSALNNARRD